MKNKDFNNIIDSFNDSIKNQLRINQLIKEIHILNHLDEYSRLKNYNLMIYKIRLLKDLLKK